MRGGLARFAQDILATLGSKMPRAMWSGPLRLKHPRNSELPDAVREEEKVEEEEIEGRRRRSRRIGAGRRRRTRREKEGSCRRGPNGKRV